MWDLNDSPDQRKPDEPALHDKGKRVGSLSDSSSSAVFIEDGSEEEDHAERTAGRKRSSKIFGFSMYADDHDPGPVTRQFFPLDESEMLPADGGGTSDYPSSPWLRLHFSQSQPHAAAILGKPAADSAQPLKKSRRGPRSRSSQYRGVTFYRRTGRWESHIWYTYIHIYIYFPIFSIIYYVFSYSSFFICDSGIVESKFI